VTQPATSRPSATSQPITLATDYVLGVAALVGGILLARKGRGPGRLATRLWAAGFLSLSAGALLGGTWHGFLPRLSETAAAVIWKGTLAAAGVAAFFLVAGSAFASLEGKGARWVAGIAAVQLVGYLYWAGSHDEYDGVIVDSGVAMGTVLALEISAWRRRRDPAAPWIASGILLSAAAAGIEALGVTVGQVFSHDDLYHLVQTGALYLLYRGGRLFRDVAGPRPEAPIPKASEA